MADIATICRGGLRCHDISIFDVEDKKQIECLEFRMFNREDYVSSRSAPKKLLADFLGHGTWIGLGVSVSTRLRTRVGLQEACRVSCL